jgi:hypothetical protein
VVYIRDFGVYNRIMIKIALTVTLSDDEVRDIGNYLILNYPPRKDARQHSLNWLQKDVIKAELSEVIGRRMNILSKNAANFKERENERKTESIPGD